MIQTQRAANQFEMWLGLSLFVLVLAVDTNMVYLTKSDGLGWVCNIRKLVKHGVFWDRIMTVNVYGRMGILTEFLGSAWQSLKNIVKSNSLRH